MLANRASDWHRLKALVLDSVSSPITRRIYNLGLDEEFISWYGLEPRLGFTKATVSAWRVTLQARGLGSVSINVRISAVRKLAVEPADNGLLAPELAAGIARERCQVERRESRQLAIDPPGTDALECSGCFHQEGTARPSDAGGPSRLRLRRSEVAALTVKHIQQRDSRWCIVDLLGKQGRVRTVPMPTWVKGAIDSWTAAVGVAEGHVLRPIGRGDEVRGDRMSEKVVWQFLQQYAAKAGVPGIAPHDLRRTCAKLCRAAGGELEQIQMLLGHASVQTTERYLGTKQDLVHAPNDGIKLRVAM